MLTKIIKSKPVSLLKYIKGTGLAYRQLPAGRLVFVIGQFNSFLPNGTG